MKTRKKADKLFYAVAQMLDRNQRQEIDSRRLKRKFHRYVHSLANGGTPKDLTPDEVWALGDDEELFGGVCNDEMPRTVCRLLGFKRGTSFGEMASVADNFLSIRKNANPK
jgi:hypothetical protein